MGVRLSMDRSVTLLEALALSGSMPGGVIHCAGGIDSAIVCHIECVPEALDMLRSHLQRNMYDTLNLHESHRGVRRGSQSRFCCACSSLIGLHPVRGN